MIREKFLQSPAADPPPGVEPNFENPSNIRGYSFPCFVLVVSIANLVFLAKLWVLLRVVKKMLLEDWILVLAWLVYCSTFTTFAVFIVNLPVGMHQWDMTNEKYHRHLYLYNCAWITYGVIMILVKTNILLQYVRIFVPDGKRCFTSVASYTIMALNVIYYTIYVFLLMFACVPRRKIWDPTTEGHCAADWRVVLLIGNAVTLLSDFIIWLIPQKVIWGLHLDKSRKVGLSALFTIGAFAIICSGVRLQYNIQLLDTKDVTYAASKLNFWGTCQMTAGFLVACLPTVPLFMNNIKKQTWAKRMGSTVRTLLRRSNNDSGATSVERGPTTIGGGDKGRRFQIGRGKKGATDVEFDELVNRTDFSLSSRVSETERDGRSPWRSSEQIV